MNLALTRSKLWEFHWVCNFKILTHLAHPSGLCLAPTELIATTTTTAPAPPQCRNFWNDQFCTFLKAISRAELNDNRCLTTDPGMTAFIRAHCYKKCCRCMSNRCPDVTEQTLWGRKFKLKHALKIFKGISSNKS